MAIHFIQSARYRIEQETGIDPKKKASLFVPKREAPVARRGFEPRQTESKSVVLPLYYRAGINKLAQK
jgi:hypothetical protein